MAFARKEMHQERQPLPYAEHVLQNPHSLAKSTAK